MKRIALHLFLIGVSAVISWWFLLRVPEGGTPPTIPEQPGDLTLTLSPRSAAPAEQSTETPEEPMPAEPPPVPAEEPAPPPPEAGTPDGDPEEEEALSDSEPVVERDPTEEASKELADIQSNPRLMEQATAEVTGKSRKGFRTTFLCSAKDQLDIARYFGEPVLLVPRAGLRPGGEYYHRLVLEGEPGIEEVREPAPLQQYRQYRDLFAFDYESLPRPLRELRRRVFVRGDVYLFAALLPPREWGLVIVRRNAALADYNRGHSGPERTHDDVRSFTMRYVRLPGDAFDIQVARIDFDDGTVVDTRNGEMR
jgi:hypothetical protein